LLTLRLVLDPEGYDTLVQARAEALGVTSQSLLQNDFFPAYRASG